LGNPTESDGRWRHSRLPNLARPAHLGGFPFQRPIVSLWGQSYCGAIYVGGVVKQKYTKMLLAKMQGLWGQAQACILLLLFQQPCLLLPKFPVLGPGRPRLRSGEAVVQQTLHYCVWVFIRVSVSVFCFVSIIGSRTRISRKISKIENWIP